MSHELNYKARAARRVRIEQAIAAGRSRAYIVANHDVTEAEYDSVWSRMQLVVYADDKPRSES